MGGQTKFTSSPLIPSRWLLIENRSEHCQYHSPRKTDKPVRSILLKITVRKALPLPWYVLLSTLLVLSACAQSREKKRPAGQSATDSTADRDLVNGAYAYQPASADGTGKFYLGREIAQVMGHLGAEWLERPERTQEERTDLLVEALELQPTDVVADIGAGTGYFSFRIAEAVPKGQVLAVDIQPEMIALLNENKRKSRVANVKAILGTITNPKLPAEGVDLVLFVDAYHEFSHPMEMMREIAAALKPGGRVALVEYRAEDPNVPIKALHKMSENQATKEMRLAGLRLVQNKDRLPWQHLMLFEKPDK
ncbi:MAG: class I SAM-dependent methyltransferase [Ferruginibacter sp.]|nr:class I SAM-dependent methyltransferase [Cytophagales bacterium]